MNIMNKKAIESPIVCLVGMDLIHSGAIFDFNRNESEAVRESHTSLQWVVLLF